MWEISITGNFSKSHDWHVKNLFNDFSKRPLSCYYFDWLMKPISGKHFTNTIGQQAMSDQPEQIQGIVKWFNDDKGFGFIELPDGQNAFVHYSAIIGSGRRSLSEGQKVIVEITRGEKGLLAENVSPLDPA